MTLHPNYHSHSINGDDMDAAYLTNPNTLVRQRKQWQRKVLNPVNDSPISDNNKSNNDNTNKNHGPESGLRVEMNSDESEEEDNDRLAQLLKSIDDANGYDDTNEDRQMNVVRSSSRNNNSTESSGGEGFLDKLESENAQLKGKLQAERDEWQEKNDQWAQQMRELEAEIARLHESGKTERDIWRRERLHFQQQLRLQTSSPQDQDTTINSKKEEELLKDLKQISEEAVRLEDELHAVTEDRNELLRKQSSRQYSNLQNVFRNTCTSRSNHDDDMDSEEPAAERIKKALQMSELMKQRDKQIQNFEETLQTKESQLQQLRRQIQQLEQTNSSILSNQNATTQKLLKEQSETYDTQIQQIHHRHKMQNQQMMEQANFARIKERNDMNETIKKQEQIIHQKDFTLQQYQQGHTAAVQKQLNAQSKAHDIQIQRLKEQHCKETDTLKNTIQTQGDRIQQYENQLISFKNQNLTKQQQIEVLEKDIHQHIQTKNKHLQQVDQLLQHKAKQESLIQKLQQLISEQKQLLQQQSNRNQSTRKSHCGDPHKNTDPPYNISSPKPTKNQSNRVNHDNANNTTPVRTNKPSSSKQSQSTIDREKKLYEAKKLLSSKYVHAAKAAQAKAGDSPTRVGIVSPTATTPSPTNDRNIGDAPSPRADPPADLIYNSSNFISPTSTNDFEISMTPQSSRNCNDQSHNNTDDDSFFDFPKLDFPDNQVSNSVTKSTLESTPTSTNCHKDNFKQSINQYDSRNNRSQPIIWEETSTGSSLKEQLGYLVRVMETHSSTSSQALRECLSDVSEDLATLDSTGQNSVVKLMYDHFRALYKKISIMERELEKTKMHNRQTVGKLEETISSPASVVSPPPITRQHILHANASNRSSASIRDRHESNESGNSTSELIHSLKSKEAENVGLKRSLKDAVRLMVPLKEHIATTEDEKRQLRDKLYSLQRNMRELEMEVNRKEMKIQNMLRDIDEHKSNPATPDSTQKKIIQEKDDKIINLQDNVDNLTHALEVKAKDLAAVKKQLADSVSRALASTELENSELENIRHQLESVQAELQIAKSNEEGLKDALQKVSREKAEILVHERGHENELSELREELKENLEEIEETRGKVSELKEELSKQVDALNRSEDEREELRQSLDSANMKLIELATKLPVLKNELNETRENEQLLNTKLKEAIDLLKPLKLHLETAEREKQVISDKLAEAHVKIVKLETKSSEVENDSRVANICLEKYKKQSKYYEAALKRLIDEKSELEVEMLKSEEDRKTSQNEMSRASNETINKLKEHLSSVLELNKSTKAMLDEVSETNQALLKDLKQSELDKVEASEELDILRKKLVATQKEMENAKFIAASCLIRIDEISGAGDNSSWISGEDASVASNNSAKLSVISEESDDSENGKNTKIRSLVDCVERLEQQIGELMLKNSDLEDTISEKNKVLLSFMSKFDTSAKTVI